MYKRQLEKDLKKRSSLLTFVIVGGGPTGVELAGSIAELSRYSIRQDFRVIDSAMTKVTLIEAGPRLLSNFNESLSSFTKTQLEKRGVEVLINSPVIDIDGTGVTLKDRKIHSKTIIWAAGVEAANLTKLLPFEKDKSGRIHVDEFCRIDLPLCRIYKRNGIEPPGSRLAREASGTLTDMPGKQGDRLDLSYFPASPFSEMLFIDQMHSHWYNLYNSQKQTGFGLCWNGEVFPYLWLWQENRFISAPPYNGQKRAMALEPQSSNEPILEQALKAGKAPYLEAGESVETWLTAVIHHEPQQVTQITQDGTLATHGEFMKTIYGN